MANYVAPTELRGNEVNDVHARMLAALPPGIDRQQGGGAWDLTRPAAAEISLAINDINVALQLAFPQYAFGEWLDLHAQAAGMVRKPANAATGDVNVTGTDGTVIPAGFLFAAQSDDDSANLEFRATESATVASGAASVPVACTTSGEIGNVDAHSIRLMVSPLRGLSAIDNTSALTGGAEEETDADLRARILLAYADRNASYVGSVADYRRWALEVSGVGSATVLSADGDGTVQIVISDTNGAPANETLCTAVYNHIMSPDAPLDRLAPINALLAVTAPIALTVTIAATVTLESGVDIATVRDAFEVAVTTYFGAAVSDGVVRYAEVSKLLLDVAGVIDHTGLTLNSTSANVTVSEGYLPVCGALTGVVAAS